VGRQLRERQENALPNALRSPTDKPVVERFACKRPVWGSGIGGGIRHVADCIANYVVGEDASGDELLSIADRLGNRAVFKRLGFLAERLEGWQSLAASCRERLSSGTAKLDPLAPCPRLVTRWRLWVPPSWSAGPA
jgi:hypothetical protein